LRQIRFRFCATLEWMIRSGGMEFVLAGLRAGTIRFSWPHA
jgi:RNA polymerase-associated protein